MKKNIIKRTGLIFAIVVIMVGAFFSNKLIIKASVARNSMRILEIEPTDNFSLTQSTKTPVTSGTETITDISSFKVTIRHMTMAEYISNVEQINGKYDVVVIGNNNTTSSVTYSAEFNSRAGYLPYGKEAYNNLSNSSTSLGMINDSTWTGTRSSKGAPDQKTYVEYYSENDITNKRANEILDCINSGQLVYIANEALSNTGTKIYSNFNRLSNKNLVKVNQSQLTLNNIVNNYKNGTAKKAPVLSITSKSQDNNRNINFVYNIATDNEEQNMSVSLYLDLNGDGLFKDKEKVKTIQNINTSNTQYNNGTISYNLDGQFVGNLTWKLEVVTNGNVKTYSTGVLDFQADANHKPTVRVLQVYPESTSSNLLDLTDNDKIRRLVADLRDYNLQISAKSTTEFNSYISSGRKLNSNYDMIILGFADSYASNDLPQASIRELKDFISTGQSVMFTHDTITYRYLSYPDPTTTTTTTPTIKSTVDSSDKSSKNITHYFRDIIGQSRYVDRYNPTEVDIYKNFNVSTGTYEPRNIPHEQLKSSDQGKVSLGITKGLLSMFQSSPTAGSYSGVSNSIYKINEGLINQYPYPIGNISVADTHYQWYQLNLEDPDVVPWFTLNPNNGNGYNQYDARNYYYTYSKGNITYSGTGHSNVSSQYGDDECMLFVNTMVKAERGANHAPTLDVDLNDGTKVSRNQSSIEFNFIPTDRDNDPINAVVTVKDGTNEIHKYSYSNQKQGEAIPVSIDNSIFNNVSGNSITITVQASDPLQAEVSQTYTINLVSNPTISLSLSNNKTGYLVGDVATVKILANSNESTQGLQTTLSNITYNITGKYNSEDVEVTSGGNITSFDDVVFKPEANPKSQPRSLSFLTKKSGQISIDGALSYNQTNITSPGGQNYKIGLPVRDGQAIVRILTGNNNVAVGDAQVKIYKNNVYVDTVTLDGQKTIPAITTGTYKFDLITCPNGYSPNVSTIIKDFDYTNNQQDVAFSVSPTAEISHGLYTNNSLITENINLTKSSNATFGVIFKTKDLTPSVAFDLDDSITNVTVDKFKLFRVNDNKTITQITDCNITKLTGTGNKFTVAFSNSQIDSNYLIQYSVKLGNNNSYTNNVTLNGISKPITITCQDLKDLF